jgi:hypothetical protein
VVAFALLALLVALPLAYLSMLLLIVDCSEESYSECSTRGYAQFGIALTCAALAVGALVAGVTGRSRPRLWLLAGVLTFATWLLVVFAVGEPG